MRAPAAWRLLERSTPSQPEADAATKKPSPISVGWMLGLIISCVVLVGIGALVAYVILPAYSRRRAEKKAASPQAEKHDDDVTLSNDARLEVVVDSTHDARVGSEVEQREIGKTLLKDADMSGLLGTDGRQLKLIGVPGGVAYGEPPQLVIVHRSANGGMPHAKRYYVGGPPPHGLGAKAGPSRTPLPPIPEATAHLLQCLKDLPTTSFVPARGLPDDAATAGADVLDAPLTPVLDLGPNLDPPSDPSSALLPRVPSDFAPLALQPDVHSSLSLSTLINKTTGDLGPPAGSDPCDAAADFARARAPPFQASSSRGSNTHTRTASTHDDMSRTTSCTTAGPMSRDDAGGLQKGMVEGKSKETIEYVRSPTSETMEGEGPSLERIQQGVPMFHNSEASDSAGQVASQQLPWAREQAPTGAEHGRVSGNGGLEAEASSGPFLSPQQPELFPRTPTPQPQGDASPSVPSGRGPSAREAAVDLRHLSRSSSSPLRLATSVRESLAQRGFDGLEVSGDTQATASSDLEPAHGRSHGHLSLHATLLAASDDSPRPQLSPPVEGSPLEGPAMERWAVSTADSGLFSSRGVQPVFLSAIPEGASPMTMSEQSPVPGHTGEAAAAVTPQSDADMGLGLELRDHHAQQGDGPSSTDGAMLCDGDQVPSSSAADIQPPPQIALQPTSVDVCSFPDPPPLLQRVRSGRRNPLRSSTISVADSIGAETAESCITAESSAVGHHQEHAAAQRAKLLRQVQLNAAEAHERQLRKEQSERRSAMERARADDLRRAGQLDDAAEIAGRGPVRNFALPSGGSWSRTQQAETVPSTWTTVTPPANSMQRSRNSVNLFVATHQQLSTRYLGPLTPPWTPADLPKSLSDPEGGLVEEQRRVVPISAVRKQLSFEDEESTSAASGVDALQGQDRSSPSPVLPSTAKLRPLSLLKNHSAMGASEARGPRPRSPLNDRRGGAPMALSTTHPPPTSSFHCNSPSLGRPPSAGSARSVRSVTGGGVLPIARNARPDRRPATASSVMPSAFPRRPESAQLVSPSNTLPAGLASMAASFHHSGAATFDGPLSRTTFARVAPIS